jgi:hypothetical protein
MKYLEPYIEGEQTESMQKNKAPNFVLSFIAGS